MAQKRAELLSLWRIAAVSAFCWLGFLAEGRAYELTPSRVFVSADGRKMMLSGDRQLLFFDGIGTDANVVSRVSCDNKRVIASRQARYVATAPAGAADVVEVRIFDSSGRQVGEFANSESYNLQSLSDAGPLAGLAYESLDPVPAYASRLYDVNGTLVGDFKFGGIRFALDGTPILLTVDPNTNGRSLSVLDLPGDFVATCEIDQDKRVDKFDVAGADGPVFAMLGPKGGVIAHTLLIWDPNSGDARKINLPDNEPGVVSHGFSISPGGEYVSLTNGPRGLLLYAVSRGSFVYRRQFDIAIEGRSFKKFLDAVVDERGRVMATGLCEDPSESKSGIGTSCFCFFDQSGEVVWSGLFGAFSERPGLQLLLDGGLVAFDAASIRIVRPDAERDETQVLIDPQEY